MDRKRRNSQSEFRLDWIFETYPNDWFCFSTNVYVLILVPLFVVGPALLVGIYLMRHKINAARKQLNCCSNCRSNSDKDGAKVENANGEFSHELQIKESNNYDIESGFDEACIFLIMDRMRKVVNCHLSMFCFV